VDREEEAGERGAVGELFEDFEEKRREDNGRVEEAEEVSRVVPPTS
jgi:hypothetical protein